MTSIDHGDDRSIDDVIVYLHPILAQELGVSVGEIADTTNLAELGMDSLMTLTVTERMREE